jgi:hypothetical protein
MYRRIKTPEDQAELQNDLNKLQDWEDRWFMQFNPVKSEVLRVTNRKSQTIAEYKTHGQILITVDSAKYLGLTIQKNLSWDMCIDKITKKANSTLSFLGRNISRCPTTIKAQCYSTLVRPTIIYASSMWSQAKKESIRKLYAVQRRTARFTKCWRLPSHKQCNIYATATPMAVTPAPSGKGPSSCYTE